MSDLSSVWDWGFFWDIFAFFLDLIAPFLMIVIAVIVVGLLLGVVVKAIAQRKS